MQGNRSRVQGSEVQGLPASGGLDDKLNRLLHKIQTKGRGYVSAEHLYLGAQNIGGDVTPP